MLCVTSMPTTRTSKLSRTETEIVVERDALPAVFEGLAVMVTDPVPGEAESSAVSVTVTVSVPSGPGPVVGFGEIDATFTPAGAAPADRLISPVEGPVRSTRSVVVFLPP